VLRTAAPEKSGSLYFWIGATVGAGMALALILRRIVMF